MPDLTKTPVTQDDMIYLGDNGRALCGAHLGVTARYTGHDLSGQAILPVTPDALAEAREMGWTPRCETCGREPSSLWH
jgi:hypothetical protein